LKLARVKLQNVSAFHKHVRGRGQVEEDIENLITTKEEHKAISITDVEWDQHLMLGTTFQ